jgi:hypothetical protein
MTFLNPAPIWDGYGRGEGSAESGDPVIGRPNDQKNWLKIPLQPALGQLGMRPYKPFGILVEGQGVG